MHCSVHEVLPCVQEADGKGKLESRNQSPVDYLSNPKLPWCKRRGRHQYPIKVHRLQQAWVMASSQHASGIRVFPADLIRESHSIESNNPQYRRYCAFHYSNSLCPHFDIVVLPSVHLLRVGISQDQANHSLDDLLQDHIPEDFIPRGMISVQNLRRCMESVVWKQIINVYYVEDHRHRPVRDNW